MRLGLFFILYHFLTAKKGQNIFYLAHCEAVNIDFSTFVFDSIAAFTVYLSASKDQLAAKY
jgi:hypothetical protein